METKDLILIATIGYFLYLIVHVSLKLKKPVKTIESFFSYGEFTDSSLLFKKLEKTLTATNASFTAAFLGLFYMYFISSAYAISFAFGYLIGMIIFARVFLPKIYSYLSAGIYIPELLEKKTGLKIIRYISSALIILSLLAFTFTEIYGFSVDFVSHEIGSSNLNSFFIAVVLLLLLSWYIVIGGYKNIVLTDSIQIIIIIIGSCAILLFAIVSFLNHGIGIEIILDGIKKDFSAASNIILIPSVFVGLGFSQLVYYENWQRLILFNKSISKFDISEKLLIKKTQNIYYTSTVYLFFLFLVPLFLGAMSKALSINSFAEFLLQSSQNNLTLKILLVIGTFTFISSLLSTIDTYYLAILQAINTDFLRLSLKDNKKVVVIISAIIAPFILFQLNIGSWLAFIFYAVSGTVGPLLASIYRKKINGYAVLFIFLFSFLLVCSIFFFSFPVPAIYIDVVNAIIVLISIIISFVFSKK